MTKFRSLWFPFFCISYCLSSLALFLFSYTQVDLSLTLTRVNIFQTIQKAFQYIGFYQRPTATLWFVLLVVVFFLLYGFVLYAVKAKKITTREVWTLIAITAFLLVLSYPAFSYDIFNYMFHAKEVVVYHKNPYLVTPLAYTGVEPWLSFMHWTHLPSAYTPLWLVLSIPSYLLGFGYFLLILWNFKLLAAFFYIITALYIGKILQIIDNKRKDAGIALFAFNPLIIFEILVSGHNDIAMMAFVVMSIFYFVLKKPVLAYLLLALSVGTKLMTIFLYPVFIFGSASRRMKWYALAAMSVGLILVLTQREILPWYLVWIIPFVALIPQSSVLTWICGGASMGLTLYYAPYLYYGHWNDPVPVIKLWAIITPIFVATICYITSKLYLRRVSK